MRTNIVIDDKLMQEAMKLSQLNTKKEVIEKALQEFVRTRSQMDLSDLHGKIRFADNYDYKTLRERR